MKQQRKTSEIQKLRDSFSENLLELLSKSRFEYKPEIASFLRQQEGFSQYIGLVTLKWNDGYSITFDIGVRYEEIENLFFELSPEHVPNSNSKTIRHYCPNVGPNSSVCFPIPGVWYLDKESDFSQISDQVRSFVDGYCLNWFKHFQDLDVVFDALLVWSSKEHQTVRAFERALLIALLQDDPNKVEKAIEASRVFPTDSPAKNQFDQFCNAAKAKFGEKNPES